MLRSTGRTSSASRQLPRRPTGGLTREKTSNPAYLIAHAPALPSPDFRNVTPVAGMRLRINHFHRSHWRLAQHPTAGLEGEGVSKQGNQSDRIGPPVVQTWGAAQ